MRILVTGDKHLGLVSDGVSRLEEQARVLRAIEDLAKRERPDLYVDLGDLFHSPRPGPDTYELAIPHLFNVNAHCGEAFFIAGNHDKPTRGSVNSLLPLKSVEDLIDEFPSIVCEPTFLRIGEVWLALLPYWRDWEAVDGNAQVDLDARCSAFLGGLDACATVLAFCHLEVPGSRTSQDDVTQRSVGLRIPQILLDDRRVARIWAGHVHHYQIVGKVCVVGSSIYVDFGEAKSRKGCVMVEI